MSDPEGTIFFLIGKFFCTLLIGIPVLLALRALLKERHEEKKE